MNVSLLAHLTNGLLMLLLPLALGIFLNRKFHLGWRLWGIGAVAFILSQVGHIPFNNILTLLFRQGILPTPPEEWKSLFNAILLGLSSGLWEEPARYVAYRWWAREARSWRHALVMGAGHGGIEAILVGVIVLLTFVNMLVAHNMDLTGRLTPEQLSQAQAQIQAYRSTPWHMALLGALERVFAMVFHLSASVLVLQVFLRKQVFWLWLAVLWHALTNALAVYMMNIWGAYAAEGALACLMLVSLTIIYFLRQKEPLEEVFVPPSQPQPQSIALPDIPETPENLEDTRYTE